jgi:hypothetical protein
MWSGLLDKKGCLKNSGFATSPKQATKLPSLVKAVYKPIPKDEVDFVFTLGRNMLSYSYN